MSAIDALPRNELRRLTQALAELLGPHAIVSLVPELRLESTANAPQLALGFVDLEAVRRDAQEWLFAVMAAARLRTARGPIAHAIDGPAAASALVAAMDAIVRDVEAAIAFDSTAGLDLAAFVASLIARSVDVAEAYPSDAWSLAQAASPMPRVTAALIAVAPELSADEATVRTAIRCCLVADRLELPEPYALLAAWVDTERDARLPALRRAAADSPRTPATLPLLTLVAERTLPSTVDAFVECAERHDAHEPKVATLLVATLERLGRLDEARYWRDELRFRSA